MKFPVFRARALRRPLALAAIGVLAAGCSLDLTNPNEPPETEVITTADGIITLAIGLQAQYADNINILVRAPALVTDEWGTRPLALQSDVSLVTGAVDPTFISVSDPFTAAYRIARTANILVENAPNVGLSSQFQAGITATARLFKAMALGHLTTQYEQLPANAGTAVLPLPRGDVRDSVIALLEQARADLQPYTDAQLEPFRTRVLEGSFDLRNTIDAMLARYYLFDGRYAEAAQASARVNPAVVSRLVYPNPGQNPIFNYSVTAQYTGARRSFVRGAQAGDQRVAYWANPATGFTGSPDSVFAFTRFGTRNADYPVYLPDEMRLIRAEVAARANNLPLARAIIDSVRTRPAVSASEPAALLPALSDTVDTQTEYLRQILVERRYELFSQGVRWEDLRRLSAVAPTQPSVQFLPYPQSECDRNPADPCD